MLTQLMIAVLTMTGLYVQEPPPLLAPQVLVGEVEWGGRVQAIENSTITGEQLVLWLMKPAGPPVLEVFDEEGRRTLDPRGSHVELTDFDRYRFCGAADVEPLPGKDRAVVIAKCQPGPGVVDLFAQILGPEGPVEGPRQVATDQPTARRLYPRIAVLRDGGYWLAWVEDRKTEVVMSPGSGRLRAMRFEESGRPRTDFVEISHEDSVSEGDQLRPTVSLVPLPDAGFAVAWREGRGHWSAIRLQAFDGEGRPRWTEPIAVGTEIRFVREPTLAVSEDGHFLLAWAEKPDEVSGTRDEWSTVRAQVFAPDGTPVSPRWNLRGLRGSELVRPSVAAVGDGFYLAWAERTERRAPLRPMGQRFTTGGRILGSPQLLLDDPIQNGWIQVEALPGRDGERVALFWQRPPPRAGDGVWLERLLLPLP